MVIFDRVFKQPLTVGEASVGDFGWFGLPLRSCTDLDFIGVRLIITFWERLISE